MLAQAQKPQRLLDARLEHVVSKILEHARRAGLRHFRYCSRPRSAPPNRAEYETVLAALEADLARGSRQRACESSVIEQLQQAASLSRPPSDFPAALRARLSFVVANALQQLR